MFTKKQHSAKINSPNQSLIHAKATKSLFTTHFVNTIAFVKLLFFSKQTLFFLIPASLPDELRANK